MFKLYHTGKNFYFLVPETKLKGSNKLVSSLFSKMKFSEGVIVLDELYKTQYGAGTESTKFITYKSSYVSKEQSAWLRQQGEPAHFTAPTAGLGAALLIECEINGISCFKITAIT